MSGSELSEILERGIAALGQDPAVHPCEAYLQFVGELTRWNRAYNLTAIRDPEQMLIHHVLDSLSVLPFLQGRRCLDVGTGAGLPGMVLALARPEIHWTLLDSKNKKIRFLRHILLKLTPDNVELVHARAADYRPDREFSTIITRALTSLADFRRITAHLTGADTFLLVMKGKYPEQELAKIKTGQAEVHRLRVPGVDSDRHLVVLSR